MQRDGVVAPTPDGVQQQTKRPFRLVDDDELIAVVKAHENVSASKAFHLLYRTGDGVDWRALKAQITRLEYAGILRSSGRGQGRHVWKVYAVVEQ